MALSRVLFRRHFSSFRLFSSSTPPPFSPPPPPPPSLPTNLNSSLTKTIKSLFKERDLDRLISIFKSCSAYPRFRRRHRIYEVAVRRLSLHRRLDGVTEILEAQKQYTSDITREGFAVRLIFLYGRAGMADRALATFLELPSLSCHRTVMSFNALLSAFVDAGEPQRVVDSFQSIPNENPTIVPDVFSYNILIHAMCEMGEVDSAVDVMRSMEEKEIQLNLITCNTLLRGYYQKGEENGAQTIWSLMGERKLHPDLRSYNEKLIGLVGLDKMPEALEIVKEMKEKGLEPNTYSFNALITAHCKWGKLSDAKKVFAEMTKNNSVPNADTFEALVPALCEAGELDLAFSLAKKSLAHLVSVNVVQGVVDGLVSLSRLGDAKKLIELGRQRECYRESLRMPLPCLGV